MFGKFKLKSLYWALIQFEVCGEESYRQEAMSFS